MAAKEVKEDVEKILRMVGWQVAAGVLFVIFGLEIAISDIVLHALQPFEHGKSLLASIGIEAVGLNGLSATALIIVGSLNLGVAATRFGKVLQQLDDRK